MSDPIEVFRKREIVEMRRAARLLNRRLRRLLRHPRGIQYGWSLVRLDPGHASWHDFRHGNTYGDTLYAFTHVRTPYGVSIVGGQIFQAPAGVIPAPGRFTWFSLWELAPESGSVGPLETKRPGHLGSFRNLRELGELLGYKFVPA